MIRLVLLQAPSIKDFLYIIATLSFPMKAKLFNSISSSLTIFFFTNVDEVEINVVSLHARIQNFFSGGGVGVRRINCVCHQGREGVRGTFALI